MDVRNKRSGHRDCTTRRSYGKNDGTNKTEFFAEHALQGMVDVTHKRCGRGDSTTQPTYGKNEMAQRRPSCAQGTRCGTSLTSWPKRCGHS